MARVKANLRRQANEQVANDEDENKDIVVGDLTIHPEQYAVTKNGESLELTHREYELLLYLAQHVGQVMTREDPCKQYGAMTILEMWRGQLMWPSVACVKK